MIYKWLHQHNNANKVIVFFSGWGFGSEAVNHLTTEKDSDVLFVYDYSDITTKLPNLERYSQCSIIAWSFGVGNYSLWQNDNHDPFSLKIAINGTMPTIHKTMGIPEKVVKHTIKTLTAESHQEFIHRCLNTKLDSSINDYLITDINQLKNELILIKQRDYTKIKSLQWDHVWISKNDRIFSSKNLCLAWKNNKVNEINGPHAPFASWSNWQQLLV